MRLDPPLIQGGRRPAEPVVVDALRFAYADPPYPGQAKRLYGEHEAYGGEVDHGDLVAQLMDEYPDGWALSTSAAALELVLPLCPAPTWSKKNKGRRLDGTGVRVLAWCRTSTPWRPVGIQYGWEPVILYGGRRKNKTDGFVRDFMCNGDQADVAFTGAKPYSFCAWIFECLGARFGDNLVDMFPGSGAVGRAWDQWSRQQSLTSTHAALPRPESVPLPVSASSVEARQGQGIGDEQSSSCAGQTLGEGRDERWLEP